MKSVTMCLQYQLQDNAGEWVRDEEVVITVSGSVWSVPKAEKVGRAMFNHFNLIVTVTVLTETDE